jgi:multidrug efflux system membrane fusion protein
MKWQQAFPAGWLAGALGVLGAGAFLFSGCSPSANAPGAGQDQMNAVAPVTVTNVVRQDVPVQISGIGNVRAYSTVSVMSENKGLLLRVGFKQGDEVHAGDLIFLIDPKPFQAALDQARANVLRDQAQLENATAEFRRAAELFTNRILAQADFDQTRANMDALKATIVADQAAVTNAEVQLSYCYIVAPITGRVGTLLVNEGNIVKDLTSVLAVINQVRPIYVDFSVPEQNLPVLRERQRAGPLKVEASIPGQESHRAEGTLIVINNQVDTNTGTILLRAEFPNADEWLWPGQFVNVVITLSIEHDAVTVPSAAIQLGQTGQHVCVVKADNTVEIRPVELGGTFGDATVIRHGLQPGERIVTSGQLRLVAGSKVKIVTAGVDPGA